MSSIKNQANDYIIYIKNEKYKCKLTFNDRDNVTIVINEMMITDYFLFGLSGVINIKSIDKPDKGSGLYENSSFSLIDQPNVKRILNSIKWVIFNKLFQIALENPNLVLKHRKIFINMILDSICYSDLELQNLCKLLPVYIDGFGWRNLGDLYGKNVYVDLKKSNKNKDKSALAASIGYIIILAENISEINLIKKIIDAKDLDQLSINKLNGIKIIKKLTNKEKKLLKMSGIVLETLQRHPYYTSKNQMKMNENFSEYLANSNSTNLKSINPTYHRYNPKDNYENDIDMIKKGKYLKTKEKCQLKFKIHQNRNGSITVNRINLALCRLDREDINALSNPKKREIYINLNSPLIQNILNKDSEVQRVMILEELSHELAHVDGFGFEKHDEDFFKRQRYLKYKALLFM